MENIIFVSPVRFDALKQRHQCLAMELAKKGISIIFVNPITSNGFSCNISKSDISKNLKIINLKIPFKSVSYPFIQKIASKIAIKLIKKKLHIDFTKNILWLAEPSLANFVNENWKKVIYDCCDLHGFFPNQKKTAWQYYESLISKKADFVFFSHPYLKDKFIGTKNDKYFILPNATCFSKKGKNNKAGYNNKIKLFSSGAHYEWVNFEWLEMLANLNNIELHIAGKGRGESFQKLLKNKNVIFHGELDSVQLAQVIEECHVGLVPFKDIELIYGVDPIKVYDYAAFGLDIWAPDLKQLYSNKYITNFIKDSDEAKKAVERKIKNLKNNLLDENAYRTDIPTWEERANFCQAILFRNK